MKQINCDVIQDLLPSYSDKVSSNATNKLVEEHLKNCKKCNIALKSMNKEIDTEFIENQEEQLDYLKKYRRNRIRSVIGAVLITIDIIFGMVLSVILLSSIEVFVNVNDVNVEYMYKIDDELMVYLYSEKYKKHFLSGEQYEVVDDEGNKEIYLKIAVEGLIHFPRNEILSGRNEFFKLDNSVKKIYIEDKKGNVKEIWNKDMSVMSSDEWKHWYIDSYAPQDIVKEYGLTYDKDIHMARWNYTFLWRALYETGK